VVALVDIVAWTGPRRASGDRDGVDGTSAGGCASQAAVVSDVGDADARSTLRAAHIQVTTNNNISPSFHYHKHLHWITSPLSHCVITIIVIIITVLFEPFCPVDTVLLFTVFTALYLC